MPSVQIKRGDTFSFGCAVSGLALGLTGWQVRSQVRQGGTLLDELTVTITDEAGGLFTVKESNAGETANWPLASGVGLASANGIKWDIRFTSPDGDVITTETIDVETVEEYTERGSP